MKRILITGFTENYGGVERIIYEYIKKMDLDDLQFDIISEVLKPAFFDELTHLGCQFHQIKSRNKNFLIYYIELITFFVRYGNRYDGVWINKCMLNNIDLLILSKIFKIKKRIVHSHSSSSIGSGFKGMIMLILHKFNKTILSWFANEYWTCSEMASRWLFNCYILKTKKIFFVPNAIEVSRFVFDQEKRDAYRRMLKLKDEFVIGHIGMFTKVKNHKFILKVFDEIVKVKQDAKLILVGDGELKSKIESLARELGLSKNIAFLGIRNDIDGLLQAFDCLMLPSYVEGFPVVTIEAQAAGLNCYVSKNNVTEAINLTNKVTFISLEQSPKIWAKCILENDNNRENVYNQITLSGFNIIEKVKYVQMQLSK